MPTLEERRDTTLPRPTWALRPGYKAPLPEGMSFSRPSAARTLDPTSGLYTSVPSGEKRIFGPQQGLLVEVSSRTNHVTWSSKISDSKWSTPGASTETEKVSGIIGGEDAFAWSADKFEGPRQVDAGTFTSGEEVVHAFVEERSADKFQVLVFDGSAENAALATIDWANEEVSTLVEGIDAHVRVLSRNSLNEGNRLAHIIIRYDPTDAENGDVSGEGRRIELRPNRTGTGQTIFHHAQIEESLNASSPIVTGSSAVTRGGDQATINVGDWWNEQEMTFFYEIIPQFFHLNGFAGVLLNISGKVQLYDTAPWGIEFRDGTGDRGPFHAYSVSPFESTKIAVSLISESDEVRLAVGGNVDVEQGGITVGLSGTSEYDLPSSFNPPPSTVVKTHRAIPKALPATDLETLTV